MPTPTVDQLPEAWKPLARPVVSESPRVTPEELDLIKRTVANDATADELELYLFDCKRQGVHPLDKLVHFTKRQGKYTPITSIDFMRTRAADSGEYAGNDDAVFEPKPTGTTPQTSRPPSSATVTVWRMVQGHRCPFAATARWSEYKPDAGTSGRADVMWLKMPHTMLAKCAEALALRKGFPRQLAGLYAKEEMDQADNRSGFVVEPLKAEVMPSEMQLQGGLDRHGETDVPGSRSEPASAVTGEQHPVTNTADLPPGAVYIQKVEGGFGKAKAFILHSGMPTSLHGRDGLAIYDDRLVTLAAEVCQLREPVILELKQAAVSGKSYVKGIRRVSSFATDEPLDTPMPTDAELDAEAAREQALARDDDDGILF